MLGDNNNETNSRKLGAIFLIVSWLLAIGFGAYIVNSTIFNTKDATIRHTAQGVELTLESDHDSHFRINGSINGNDITFLVDTGASTVAVSKRFADKAGLKVTGQIATETANGTAVGYSTRIETLKLGDIELHNIRAIIIPDLSGEEALLGMNVIGRFKVQQTKSTMTLTLPEERVRN